MNSDSTHTINQITTFIHTTLSEANKTKAVVAVSGGIDSAVSLSLAVKALGAENVYPIFLPYGNQPMDDAEDIATHLEIPSQNWLGVDIAQMVHTFVDQLHQPDDLEDELAIRKGNIMARCRMIVIYDQAKKLDALVVGTENKSEKYLGYFTRFGDEASDLEPLQHLYKTQVRQLARELKVPESIQTKQPSAGLWAGQTDEEELGFSYEQADQVLMALIDQKMPVEEIEVDGVAPETIAAVAQRVKQVAFKHQVPYTL